MKCKDCKYFDNTKPVTMSNNEEHKYVEDYIGECTNINRIKMMNDTCPLAEKKEKEE